MLRRSLALGLSVPLSVVFTLACSVFGAGQDLPALAAQEWFDAVVSTDIETALTRTCLAMKESSQLTEMWAAAETEITALLAHSGDGGIADAEAVFSTIERQGAIAVVALADDNLASSAQATGSDISAASWIMILEEGKWRWCGSGTVPANEATQGTRIAPQAEASSTDTPKVSTVTSTSTKTRSPQPSATKPGKYPWNPCRGAPLSNLHQGDRAYVGHDPPLPNRVRDKPNWDTGLIVGRIFPGEEIEIIDGPRCNNSVVWWMVSSQDKDLVGWTAEGDHDDYWLIRLP